MNTEDLYKKIDDYLLNYGDEDAEDCIYCTSTLDGFFAAIGCAPQMIPPSRWMPAIWGGEKHAPAWETMEQAQDFISAIMTMYNDVMQTLSAGEFDALFMEREIKGKTDTIVDDWCTGFLMGANLWGPLPSATVIAIEDHLQPIRMFATEKGFEQLDQMSEEEVAFWQNQIEPAVSRIFNTLRGDRQQPEQTPSIQKRPKTSRNDPCPCGSGKKYKKCCLH